MVSVRGDIIWRKRTETRSETVVAGTRNHVVPFGKAEDTKVVKASKNNKKDKYNNLKRA